MESTHVESQEPLLHGQTETSSQLKPEAAPQSPFHTGSERPYRDSTFTFLFLIAILTTFTFGIIAYTRTDILNMDTKLRLSKYNPNINKCEITQEQTPMASDSDPTDSDSAFVKLVALIVLFALALTIPLSLLLVSLLRRYTHTLVVLSAPFMSFLFLGLSLFGIFLSLSLSLDVPEVRGVAPRIKQIYDSVSYLFVLALPGYILWENWIERSVPGSTENGVELLRMATGFWKEHFVLLVLNPVLLLGTMVLVNGPIFTFIWYAFNVGEVVPDFDVVNDPIKGCDFATGIPCCRGERPGWVNAYITFASFTAFWVFTVSTVLQHSVVSGTVSLWYFAPTGSSAIGNIKRALGNAYGPSFGTSCNLGTIVTTLAVISVRLLKKRLNDKVLENNGRGMMFNIIWRCFPWVSQFLNCYPQLHSIFLGISESSKKPHQNLLQRTSPISTTMTNSRDLAFHALMAMTFICTLLQIPVVFAVLEYFSDAHVVTNFMIAVVYCSPIAMAGLGSGFSQAVSSVIESVSDCYAMERDFGEISKPEVCRAFMSTAPLLPENGARVAGCKTVGGI